MRKVILAGLVATAALGLAACSQEAQDAAADTTEAVTNDVTEGADAMGDAVVEGADKMGAAVEDGAAATGDAMADGAAKVEEKAGEVKEEMKK